MDKSIDNLKNRRKKTFNPTTQIQDQIKAKQKINNKPIKYQMFKNRKYGIFHKQSTTY